MNYNSYSPNAPVIELDENSRGQFFLSRTYNHLFGAIIAFTLIEVALFKTGLADRMALAMLGTNWLFILGGFMVISWVARAAAHRSTSMPAQYAALTGYVIGEAIIFVPLLYLADRFAPGAIASAALVTLLGFTGLSAVVFITRKDFSFLRGILSLGAASLPWCSSWPASSSASSSEPFSPSPWLLWPAVPSCTTPRTSSATIPPTAMSRPRSNCSPTSH